VDQLASQPQDNAPAALQLTIPFTDGNHQDSARLFITPDTSETSGKDSPSSWTAAIELQPPGIGKFNARLVWNGARIEATLWSDREETGALMRSHCELLRARLEQAGLEAGKITVLDQPPASTPKKTDTLPLLDLHA
jgi:flagellar hook-length control protein FliK